MSSLLRNTSTLAILAALSLLTATSSAPAQTAKTPAITQFAWGDKTLSPDRRADMVLQQMTLDEKLQMVHGAGWGVLREGDPVAPRHNHGAGFMPGIDRLGIPDINQADSAVGVRMAAYDSRYATLLPSTLALASSWDPHAAHLYGEVIGRELRDQGFNMSIGGGVDLTREPRNGRNFEYAGEDPVLAGNIVGQLALGVQSQKVMGDIKHYAFNDQETGRNVVNVKMGKREMRETDLLAFEIAIKMAKPAGVMCSYNLVNGEHACQSDYLLNQVLKKYFGFQGWVVSDWEATHSTVASANAGLDQEMPGEDFFGAPLKKAIQNGEVPISRLDDMVHRILRSMFAVGVIDQPPVRRVVDPFRGREDAQHIAEESIVLLKNEGSLLPLHPAALHSIAIIGGHADVGVLSGGGSAQVDAPGGNAINPSQPTTWGTPVYFPSSPMKALQKLAPSTTLRYAPGTDLAAATQLARSSDLAIVFVTQYMSESVDAPTLSLPDHQDALVAAIAAANPRTIVVLETGGPVTMPWIDHVPAVLAAWYPGIGGGEAIANLLTGQVNPSGKLPITFARADSDLPQPTVPGLNPATNRADRDLHANRDKSFDLTYKEGLAIGYRWYQVQHIAPLFAFGHGLSYTTFQYSNLHADPATHSIRFEVKNTGTLPGAEIAQLYVTLPAASAETYQRLAGFQRLQLAPGQSQTVTLPLDPAYLSIFDEAADHWVFLPGSYQLAVGPSSQAPALTTTIQIAK